MPSFEVRRFGVILAVADVERSVSFYTETLGFAVEALYDDPPYVTLTRDAVRLSLAEEGHTAPDRPGTTMVVPQDPTRLSVVLVLEVDDARDLHRRMTSEGARLLAEPYAPPWGGLRFFVVDPDGYVVELEQPA